ncbi:MAG: mevalonate kinase, partial [Dermabacter sp.]|nr:mevalonate kinase [Dermabacter sp.]
IEGSVSAEGFGTISGSYSLTEGFSFDDQTVPGDEVRFESGLTLDVPSSRTGERRGKRRIATVGDPSTGAIYLDVDTEEAEDELAQSALRTILSHVGEKPGRAEVTVEGSIPTARGLGSSAAMASAIAVAVARLYGHELTSEERFELVQFVERIAHGTPSGLDAYQTMADGPLWFQAGKAEPLELAHAPALVVADTGLPGHTLDAVRGIRERRERDPRLVDLALETIASLAHTTREALRIGDMSSVGRAMNDCQEILTELGVSHSRLEHLVGAARDAGALGAKLTGGGLGGCIIALAPSHGAVPALSRALSAAGAKNVWSINPASEESS